MDPGLMPNLRRVTRRHGLLAECRLKLTDPSLNCRQQGEALIETSSATMRDVSRGHVDASDVRATIAVQ